MAQLTAPAPTDLLAATYRQVRAGTEALAAPLSAEDQTVQSMPDASPTKWHRAHTSWFFETFLLEPLHRGYQVFHPAYTFLFNSYYEQVGARHPRPQRGVVSRPGIAEIAAYRRHVDEAMAELLARTLSPDTVDLVALGVQHEQQHQELLLMDIKHALSCNAMLPAYEPRQTSSGQVRGCGAGAPQLGASPENDASAQVQRSPQMQRSPQVQRSFDGEAAAPVQAAEPKIPPLSWDEHRGGLVAIGHGDEHAFCFDNELPRHQEWLAPYAMASRPATCGEWVEFIEDGGYLRPELWLSDGWGAVHAGGWRAPLYWTDVEGHWEVFTLHGRQALDLAEPVCHVSYYEADAFARWSGARLPTEAEWEAAAAGEVSSGAPRAGASPGDGTWASVVGALHPRPMGPRAPFAGDVWQWTQSAYSPYPGYRPAAGAVGEYNGKFMVNQYVLRGGSCVTPMGHARVTYRNFFPASARWSFSGVRLAADR